MPYCEGDGRIDVRERRYTGEHAMPVTIADEFLEASHLSAPQLKREIALTLFQQDRLTLGQASRLAEMTRLEFQALLADNRVPIHYGVDEFREDLET
jgi:predicted HTH domain antitoxin